MRTRRAPRLVEIREDFAIPGPNEIHEVSASILVGEEIDNLGIHKVTSELYHAIVSDVPCALGGVVNINERMYFPAELSAEHTRLCSEAAERFIDGELGHAQGAETQNIPVRFLGGTVKEQPDGTVLTLGRFGILRTTEGTDTWVLYQAGFPIGVSLVGLCYMTEAVLRDDHPFAKINESHIGQEITFCTGLRLRKHDIVRRASFGTYFPASEEASRALLAIDEAGLLPISPLLPVSPGATNEPGEAAEEDDMTHEELVKHLEDHPEVAASYRAGVTEDVRKELQKTDPLADATDKEKAVVARILEHVRGDDPEQGVKAVVEQSNAQVRELEAQNASLRKTMEATTLILEEIRLELSATKLRTQILEEVDKRATGATYGSLAKAHVLGKLDEQKVSSVEEAARLFDEIVEMCTGVAGVQTLQAISPSVGDPADVTKTTVAEGSRPAADPVAKAPGLLSGNHAISHAMRNRKRAGGVL